MDGVKRALNDRRMDMREASERAWNRNEWRMIVRCQSELRHNL